MIRFPWWGSVILAIIGYIGLKYGVVYLLEPENRLSGLLPQFAPVVAMGLLLLAAKQLYDNDPHEEDNGDEEDKTSKKQSTTDSKDKQNCN